MKNFIRRRAHVRAQINVLIACEESQRECIAFRNRGFNAFSYDTQVCGGKHPEWHIHGDVSPYLCGQVDFVTQDGREHHVTAWHLIVAHPPCTYLCKVSSVHMVIDGHVQWPRLANMIRARRFFMNASRGKYRSRTFTQLAEAIALQWGDYVDQHLDL